MDVEVELDIEVEVGNSDVEVYNGDNRFVYVDYFLYFLY